jgi:hypothetical protein
VKFSDLTEAVQNLGHVNKTYKVTFYWGDKRITKEITASSADHAKHKIAYLFLKEWGKPTDKRHMDNLVYDRKHGMKATETNEPLAQPPYASPEISSYAQLSLPPGDRD